MERVSWKLWRDYDTDTYRCVYTVKFEEAVYVLHSFRKKSTQGIKTPQRDIDIIDARLKEAEELHKQWLKSQLATGEQDNSGKPKRKK